MSTNIKYYYTSIIIYMWCEISIPAVKIFKSVHIHVIVLWMNEINQLKSRKQWRRIEETKTTFLFKMLKVIGKERILWSYIKFKKYFL